MKSLRNSVQLIGRLGQDPDVKETAKGLSIAKFSIATTDTYRNAAGEKVEDTQWHNVVIFGKRAGVAGQYLRKGSEIALEGRLVHDTYEDAKGVKKYFTQINVNDFVMLGSRPK